VYPEVVTQFIDGLSGICRRFGVDPAVLQRWNVKAWFMQLLGNFEPGIRTAMSGDGARGVRY